MVSNDAEGAHMRSHEVDRRLIHTHTRKLKKKTFEPKLTRKCTVLCTHFVLSRFFLSRNASTALIPAGAASACGEVQVPSQPRGDDVRDPFLKWSVGARHQARAFLPFWIL